MTTMTPTRDASVYTDLHGLQSLKKGADPENPETLRAVAKQFEGMMLSMMLKSMREANAAFEQDGYFNSSETRFYRDMFDQQLTLDMANNGGVGLADVLVRQLSRQAPDRPKAADSGLSMPGLEKLDRLDRLQRLERLEPAADLAPFDRQQAELGGPRVALRPLDAASRDKVPADDFLDVVQSRIVSAARTVRELAASVSGRAPAQSDNGLTSTSAANEDEQPGLLGEALKAADAVASAAKTFASPAEFVKKLYPLAEHAAGQLGVDPKALLAQAALETGWGKHVIGDGEDSSFNLFGIKADSRWDGERRSVNTLEFRDGIAEKVRDAFRSYQSYAESFLDYVAFIQRNPRYQEALSAVEDPAAYFDALQDAGYATDPQYSRKIQRILNSDVLQAALPDLK